VFNISPTEAMNTPMKLLVEMLSIHTEVETLKAKEMQKSMK